jgi:ABC-type methionine transport system ATPase subunit
MSDLYLGLLFICSSCYILYSSNFKCGNREDWEICMQFKKKQKDFRYKKSQEGRRMLPAWDHRDVILEAVRQHQVVVIHGETGCGKSTQVRLALYNSSQVWSLGIFMDNMKMSEVPNLGFLKFWVISFLVHMHLQLMHNSTGCTCSSILLNCQPRS